MNLSPKARANMAMIVADLAVFVPYFIYYDVLALRTSLYIGLLMLFASILIYQWVYHRELAKLPAVPPPAPLLNLSPEPLPAAVWLATGPPILVFVALWWVTTHGNELPWRVRGPGSLGSYMSYRMFIAMMIFLNGFAAWLFIRRLAEWHGMSRAYTARRQLLLSTLAIQWVTLFYVAGCATVTAFMLPPALEWSFGITGLGGCLVFVWTNIRLQRIARANPHTGQWCYVDSRDPAFLGPRGLNLANGWSWILATSFIAPIALIEWLLHRLQA